MGCDIRSLLVKRNPDETVTVLRVQPLNARDYRLFGVLAGVRGINTPFIEPRGLPHLVYTKDNAPYDVTKHYTEDALENLYCHPIAHGKYLIGDFGAHNQHYYTGNKLFGLYGYCLACNCFSKELTDLLAFIQRETRPKPGEEYSDSYESRIRDYYLIFGFDS